MVKRKMLALDLDGTLLDDNGTLGAESARKLEQARLAGNIVCFVTGRREVDMLRARSLLSHADYIIYNNGTKIVDPKTGAVLHNSIVPPEVTRILVDYCLNNHLQLYVFSGCAYALNIITPGAWDYINAVGFAPLTYTDARQLDLRRVEGFLASRDWRRVNAFIEKAQLPLYCVCSEPECLDIMPHTQGKWSGLVWLAARLSIAHERIIAAGNYENDVEMIRNAGLGIAVKNALACVKQVANYITARDNNHDAAAEIIDLFVL